MAGTGYDIVCLSVLDWKHPTLTSTQLHLMRELAARGHRIFFVNPPLRWLEEFRQTRSEKWLRDKLTAWHKGFVPVEPNVFCFTPPPQMPQNRIGSGRAYRAVLKLNQAIFRQSLRRALAPHGVVNPLLWIALEPILGDAVIGRLDEQFAVYHCTDELDGFGTYSPHLLKLEASLIERSQALITTSQTLLEIKQIDGQPSLCLPNAADVALFGQALELLPEPAELEAVPHPRFGFVGQIEYRFDTELVYNVATTRPDWHFVLIGPIQPGYTEEPPLLKLPNVHAIGPRPVAAIPAYLRSVDVTLIPYRLNQLTRAIYPLKLHEYLAAGKPVLATRLPALEAFASVVELVSEPSNFIERAEYALSVAHNPVAIAERVAVAGRNSWASRADTVLAWLDECLYQSSQKEEPLNYHSDAFSQDEARLEEASAGS